MYLQCQYAKPYHIDLPSPHSIVKLYEKQDATKKLHAILTGRSRDDLEVSRNSGSQDRPKRMMILVLGTPTGGPVFWKQQLGAWCSHDLGSA